MKEVERKVLKLKLSKDFLKLKKRDKSQLIRPGCDMVLDGEWTLRVQLVLT